MSIKAIAPIVASYHFVNTDACRNSTITYYNKNHYMLAMKYLIQSSESHIRSIKIAEDLSCIILTGDVCKIKSGLAMISRFYVHSYINDEVHISGLASPLISYPTLIESICNHPSIYAGIYSIKFILSKILPKENKLYDQILEDVDRVSAELDQQFYFETMQFKSLELFNPTVLPEEKKIVSSSDVASFKGRIVAFRTNIPKFASSHFVSPLDQRYRFALINNKLLPRGSHSEPTEWGYDMYCFITSRDNFTDTPLINYFLRLGKMSMRIATVAELEYLRAAERLNQGFFTLSRSLTMKSIQQELALRKVSATVLDDASIPVPATDDSVACSSAPLLSASPSYVPVYHSKGTHRNRSKQPSGYISSGKSAARRRK